MRGSKNKATLFGRKGEVSHACGPRRSKWPNPRRTTRPRLETHRPVIGRDAPPGSPSPANGGAVRGDDSRVTQLNTHHVAHMYRVEVTTPHPDRQPADRQTDSRGWCPRWSGGLCNSCTASRVTPTATSCAAAPLLLTCLGRRGGGASTGLTAPEELSWAVFFRSPSASFLLPLRSNAFAFMRNERRVLGSEHGTVFARCRLRSPHRVRRREGKAQPLNTATAGLLAN